MIVLVIRKVVLVRKACSPPLCRGLCNHWGGSHSSILINNKKDYLNFAFQIFYDMIYVFDILHKHMREEKNI